MQAWLKPSVTWNRLRSTYWFVPALLAAAAVALAVLMVGLDRRAGDDGWQMGWLYGGGAEGARGLLSAVAGSMITVVSVTFSVTIVALTVSSQHFGPRLLNSFMRDTPAQVVLGTIIGTFAYCLVVLRTVTGEGDDRASFVPHLAVTVAVALALVSVAALIYFIHHISVSLQIATITTRIFADLQGAIERLYPEQVGAAQPLEAPAPPPCPHGAARVSGAVGGYVQRIEGDALLTLAAEHDVVIWLETRPGDFVTPDTRLAAVSPAPQDMDAFARRLTGAFVIGPDRTSYQDAGFAVQQFVEVALHALSPGMNEPFTAITCIDRLGEGLAVLARREIPSSERLDGKGRLRVVASPVSFAELLAGAFTPIAAYADRNAAIYERLLRTLSMLARVSRRQGDLAAIGAQAQLVWEQASRNLPESLRGDALSREHQRIAAVVSSTR